MLIYKVESTFRIIVKWVADKISRLFKRCLGRIVLGIIVMYDLEAGIRLFCLSGTCFFFYQYIHSYDVTALLFEILDLSKRLCGEMKYQRLCFKKELEMRGKTVFLPLP